MEAIGRCLLVDWGDTLMRVFPEQSGPMYQWPRVEVLPGAAEVLTALSPGWTLALATNAADSDEGQIRRALARVDLDRLFPRIYCFRRVGHKKPSPDFFASILRDLGLPVSRVWMLGDDFTQDVRAANACGIPAIWYNAQTSERREGALYRTVHHWSEVPPLLQGAT